MRLGIIERSPLFVRSTPEICGPCYRARTLHHALPKTERERLGSLVAGSCVDVYNVGSFRYPRQNTVFLHCDGIALPKVWFKPGRPYVPHLTFYDGSSTDFASELVALLRQYKIQFQFTATQLYQLVSSNGQKSFELRAAVDEPEFRAFMADAVINLDEVKFLGEASRLYSCPDMSICFSNQFDDFITVLADAAVRLLGVQGVGQHSRHVADLA